MKHASEMMHEKAGPDLVVRIELLEGVRGFLASWVMIGHFILFLAIPATMAGHSPWLLHQLGLLANGGAAVGVFMIISGFVISHLIISRRESYKVYITRRLLRLFPAFVCCLALGFFVSPLQSALRELPWSADPFVSHQAALAGLHRAHTLANILAHLTMLHGLVSWHWWPDSTGAFIGVGWSISTEWQFYLVAPLLLWLAKSFRGLVVVSLILISLNPEWDLVERLHVFINESSSLLAFHLQQFFIGGVSYQLWRKWRESLAGAGAARPQPRGLILCGAALGFCVPDLTLGIWVFLFSCLCQIAAAPGGIEARMVQAVGCSEPALFIGRISYSIYLAHWPVAIILLHFTRYVYSSLPLPAFWGLFLATASLATIGLATLLYYYVEAPAIRWGKRLFKET